ncbi:minichromosome maintenance protein MCM [Halosimplex rubrum]|uniref:DNA helicase n=1 Tax=Halosimplex rubrum TaxID=869889 RepID=A0A7D5T809_9EURY|nr:minichromosome maintenance protein MCM [Halosimplex rubrum]QLH78695.1 minichromosome maintenance protein MCM [Halosimplex rubrum]
MTTTNSDHAAETTELVDLFLELYRDYYREEIGTLAQHYPQEQTALNIDHDDLYRFDPDFRDDYLANPEEMREYAEEALRLYDLPVDVNLGQAHARVHNLPDDKTHFPGEFSPTAEAGEYRTIRGDVLVSTDTYSKIERAAFECKRCGTLTHIPQTDGDFQEPHECQGCERQGPFRVNFDQSEFVDGETIQLQTPPEVATGTGRTLQVFVEGDLTDRVEMGDRIAVSGVLHLNQQTEGRNKGTGKFEPYLEGHHIEIEEATQADLDIDADTKARVDELANGAEGDPLTVAAESFATEVYGYLTEKKALILALIGGATNTPDIRGKFHVLLIGDPSTSKSILINRANDVAVRAIAVSGQQSSSAGLVSTATQGEFSDGRWTLSPGAFVKANEGVVTIDELDDMAPEDRKAMLEPMANQQVNVSKAGINATLSTQTAVMAAANPKYSRFDPYEPLDEQFGFDSNLLSRFDLVFTFKDRPDQDNDEAVGDHVTQYRDAKVREHRGEEIPEAQQEAIAQPVDDDTLQVWLALANRQPDPVYESDAVREKLRDSFVTLRGANGYAEDAEVPVTFRKLPGVERVARAHAKLEFSPVITDRHAEQAMELVGQSLQDYQKTEDGTLDADISESGESKTQRDRKKQLVDVLQAKQADHGGEAPREAVVEAMTEDGHEAARVEQDIQALLDNGRAIEPSGPGSLKYIGGY